MRIHNIYILATVLFILCTYTYASGETPNALPSSFWKVGDSWNVRSWHCTGALPCKGKDRECKPLKLDKEKPFIINFEVTGIKSLEDFAIPYMPSKISERVEYNQLVEGGEIRKNEIKCFEVRVTFPSSETGFQERYLLYLREDTGNLIRISNISQRTDGSIINAKTDYSLDPNGPIITTDELSAIPFDWPNWQRDQITVEEEEVSKLRNQEIKGTLIDIEGKSYNGFEVTMRLVHKKDDETENVLSKTVQKWGKNAKWWQEIKRYNEKGEIIAEAVLVRE